jgi:hypothetical protein
MKQKAIVVPVFVIIKRKNLMLFRYTAKTLFTGYKLGLKSPSLYVGVPKKYFKPDRSVPVKYGEKLKYVRLKDSVYEQTFNDRFRPGKKYTLTYYLWKRIKKSELNN